MMESLSQGRSVAKSVTSLDWRCLGNIEKGVQSIEIHRISVD